MAPIRITERLFAAFINCRYKAKLMAEGQTGVFSAYAQLQTDIDNEYRQKSLEDIVRNYEDQHAPYSSTPLSDAIGYGYQLIVRSVAAHGNFVVAFEALEREPSDQTTDQCRYSPLLFLHRERLTRYDRLLVGFYASVLSDIQHSQVARGKIVHGHNSVVTNVQMARRSGPTPIFRQAQHLIDELAQQLSGRVSPSLLLNDHCSICEFKEHCRAKAVEGDSLTLLQGITPREIARHNERGIFTIKQLSYTFRQRRRPKRKKDHGNPHNFALQALSLRENKVHIHDSPSLPLGGSAVYLDIEGIPDRNSYYLIGVLIASSKEYRAFWADSESGQDTIFGQLADLMAQHGDCTIFHYGSYEPGTLRLAVAILAACVPEAVALATAMRYARIVLARIDDHYWTVPVGAVRAWVVAHYPGQMPERARMAMRLMSAAM